MPRRDRPRVGLALSAGSAKGLAHIGVIQVLEENGIRIDAVAGASMGAYVGACWCCGHDGRSLADLAATIIARKHVIRLLDPVFPPRRGFIKGLRVRERLRASIGDATFDQLVRPLHVVATDLDTLAEHVISSGRVADAVHASLSMPGVCEPVSIDGHRCTDGAVCDPLPVAVLEDLGMDRIIAVNTQPTLEQAAVLGPDGVTGEASRWQLLLRATGRYFNRNLNYFASGNLLDTVMRSLQAAQMRLAEAAGERADVYIRAYPEGFRWYDFHAHANAIETGRRAALAQLPALLDLTGNPYKRHES